MGLKRFEEYAKSYLDNKSEENIVKNIKSVSAIKSDIAAKPQVSEKKKVGNVKTVTKTNENSFLVGSDYKVKIVIDVPQSLVKEYIDKVKEETDKDPLDNFSEAEIAEQIISFLIKQNLVIDNLTPEFTVGSETIGNTEKTSMSTEDDAEELSTDLGVEDENSDGEIEFKDMDNTEEISTSDSETEEKISDGEIEFDGDKTEETNLGEERDVDTSENEPESKFDEFEFEDGDTEETNKPKTVGDFKKSQGEEIDKKHEEETTETPEEEEEIEDMYKKIGYKVGYYEKLSTNIFKNN